MVSLEAARLFRSLKPDELKVLRSIVQEKSFPEGQEIFREGDPGNGVYVVKEGLVEICGGGPDPKSRRVFSQFPAGEVFGEMAVIDHRPRSASAIAAKDTTVFFIPRGEMLTLIERMPGLALCLLQDMSQRFRDFNQRHIREVLQAEQLAVLGRFARTIVHDLKNPLTIIGLTAEVACSPNANQAIREQSYQRIRKQIDRISELVGEILMFTQGSQNILLLPMNYSSFIEQMLQDLRHETEVKGVSVELANAAPDLTLRLDPKRLRRVFLNLAHNACDFMAEGGKIILRFQQTPTEIVTDVEDTGPGIAPEIAGQLFEAFATHGKAHGTGLGLSICKKIIEDHGGRISARNQDGGGAVFSFTLPVSGEPLNR